ncbi:hypothetical protein [Pseudohongiella spirulinae]|uniref:hypothetical protein n=1 Tax=Pseudohongiella spirulinae TaxID=1249552 RepID=UPI0012E3B609|nr:hypothetical protein [Pseudohongiella spirulinae]
MIIDFYSKNLSLLHTLEINAKHVPRVGEQIVIEEAAGYVKKNETMLVHDVSYLFRGDSLVPYVQCHASSGPDNRYLTLQENGWLEPG